MTVCVVSLPERAHLLSEALASVHAQTVQPDGILVGIDPRVVGEAENMNRLIRAASTEHVAFLHDDDLFHPTHLETGLRHDADFIVSNFDLIGRPASTIEPHHCDYADLERTNWFWPGCVIVRRDHFLARGGFTEAPHGEWVDWTTWKNHYRAGATFACTHQSTAVYRFGLAENGSWR